MAYYIVRRNRCALVASAQLQCTLYFGDKRRMRLAGGSLCRALFPGLGSDVTGRPFLQEQFRRLHSRIHAEPSLHNALVQQIGDRQQSHALVMHHP